MPLTFTPVYDRAQSDIDNETAKGFFNVSDWNRIATNAEDLLILFNSIFGTGIVTFPDLEGYTINDFPGAVNFNELLSAIEGVRAYIATFDDVIDDSTSELKTDWLSGPNASAWTYRHVNDWERYTELLYNRISIYSIVRKARTGIAIANAGLTRNNSFRG